jgi:hypothetical protein
MPLIAGKTHYAIGKNIKTEMEHGKPHDQAVAIAMRKAGESRKKKRAKTIMEDD